MKKEELYQLAFQLILHSGNARSSAMEAMQAAKKGDFSLVKCRLADSDKELIEAHQLQTKLMQNEAAGEKYDIPIILVHAQDHVMTAMTLKEMADEIIELWQEITRQRK
ncbi:PTS lactose/cellobiose transporter subunit IIA [Cytobacillus sp. Hz8]|uniref:PTS lactose/cellobiose transporter subunit IIA n=1 Tax=Cytobacillus sp. Hz8 TaxID=3347168 RepID=UPI0035E222A5